MEEDSFDFIDNQNLKDNIIDSISYVATLWIQAESIEKRHHQELYRTIIFYNASIVEALLLFLCTKKSILITQDKYTEPHKLPDSFQKAGGETYIAIKKKVKKTYAEISFADTLGVAESFLGKSLFKKITDLKDLRNTVHLAKSRTLIKQEVVKDSSDTVFKLVKKIQKEISLKR